MKKTLLTLFIFSIAIQASSQNYVAKNPARHELVRSDFSVGISPFVFIPSSEYIDEPGLGLELIGLYGLDKNFSVGGFLKIKSGLNGSAINPPGSGYSNGEKVFRNTAGSVGAIFEYKIFNKVGFNVRLGYEDVFSSTSTASQYIYNPSIGSYTVINYDNDPGIVYGGGVSLYLNKPDYKRAVHSFNWTITFESNNDTEFPILDLSINEFRDTKMNAFYFQFGWRIQFHSLKAPKN